MILTGGVEGYPTVRKRPDFFRDLFRDRLIPHFSTGAKRTTLSTARGKMKKYWHVLNIGIQNNLTYRFNFLARAVFGLIPLVAMLYVWQKIYSGKVTGTTVGAYTLPQMISYSHLTTGVETLTAVNKDA